MKLVLFVLAFIYYSSQFTVKAGKKAEEECKANFFDQFISPKTKGCPCWPSYLQDIICTCSQSASGPFESGTDHDITCKIKGADAKNYGTNLLACGGGYKNYISPYFEPLFLFERFGKSKYGICLNAPAGLADVITLIIKVIRELEDVFDEICDFDEKGADEIRRRLMIEETQSAFKYMEELMTWTPSDIYGPAGAKQRDHLAALIFKPGGIADIAMQMIGLYELKGLRNKGKGKGKGVYSKQTGNRRLLGNPDYGCESGDCGGYRSYEDGPDICPYRFLKFLNYKTRGKYDPDQNPLEYILEELECAVDHVDCDNIYEFQRFPVRCSIKRALDNPVRDQCKNKKKGGKDCDCEEEDEYGNKYGKNQLTEYFKSLPDIRLFLTAYDQTASCEKGLFKAAELLDDGITRPTIPSKPVYAGSKTKVAEVATGEDAVDVDGDADATVKRIVRYGGCVGGNPCDLLSDPRNFPQCLR